MKRLLCIVGSMNAGGAETFLMKIYRNLNRAKYQMDFCVSVSESGVYDEEICTLGGKIHHTVPKSRGFIKSFMSIMKIVRENDYKYVMRISQHSLSGLELLAAKLGGAKTTVFRSSNTSTGGGRVNRLLHRVFIPITMFLPSVKIAPSSDSADFMFGNKSIEKGNAHILHNGIDFDQYQFSKEKRASIREEFGIGDELIVGHIGRFSEQKNHVFLISVFNEIKKQIPNAKLMLVGKGEKMDVIQKLVAENRLEQSVIFTGVRSDVPELLSAMDVFVFPSFHEGLPNTVIEAQASGLYCIISDTITREVNISGNVSFLPLSETADYWAKSTINASKKTRMDNKSKFYAERYDIDSVTNDFIHLIFED